MRPKTVKLTDSTRTFLIASALEVYPKETNGFLLCKRRAPRGTVIADGSYSIQTEKRGTGQIGHGNIAAVRRLIASLSLMEKEDFLGGFHSHPDADTTLSGNDMKHIEEEMKRFERYGINMEEWLEIVVSIIRKEYTNPKEPGWEKRHYARKIGFTLRTPSRTRLSKRGYEIVMAAFWVFKEKGKFRKEEIRITW